MRDRAVGHCLILVRRDVEWADHNCGEGDWIGRAREAGEDPRFASLPFRATLPAFHRLAAARLSVSIFLSAVSDEFSDYRAQLRRDLTRHNVEVKIQEDFVDLGGDTLAKLDTYVAHCDAVVHLVGDMTGSGPDDAGQQALLAKHPDLPTKLPPLADALKSGAAISYTQWEAWLALYHDKLLLSRLAQSDPGNTAWQRDLSISHNRMGDALTWTGKLPDALKSYQDDFAIAERLARSDPTTLAGSAIFRCHTTKLAQSW